MFLLRHIWAVVHVWLPKTPSAFAFNDLAADRDRREWVFLVEGEKAAEGRLEARVGGLSG